MPLSKSCAPSRSFSRNAAVAHRYVNEHADVSISAKANSVTVPALVTTLKLTVPMLVSLAFTIAVLECF